MTDKSFRRLLVGATTTAVGAQVFAAKGPPWASPWTTIITTKVPVEVTFAAIGALTFWLPIHFYRAYNKRGKL